MYKIRFMAAKILKIHQIQSKNPPFKGGAAQRRGIFPTSRMHVLCPQIRKNCEYQRKISAATIHFLVGKICNNSDQKTSGKHNEPEFSAYSEYFLALSNLLWQ